MFYMIFAEQPFWIHHEKQDILALHQVEAQINE
jgi:hypothetical protein